MVPALSAASSATDFAGAATTATRRGMRRSSSGVGPLARVLMAMSRQDPSARKKTVQTSPTTSWAASVRRSGSSR